MQSFLEKAGRSAAIAGDRWRSPQAAPIDFAETEEASMRNLKGTRDHANLSRVPPDGIAHT